MGGPEGVDAGNRKVPKTQPLPLRGSQGGRRDKSETLRGSGPRAVLPGLWGRRQQWAPLSGLVSCL